MPKGRAFAGRAPTRYIGGMSVVALSKTDTAEAPAPLLGPGDPPPFRVENAEGAAPVVILCDHAANTIPKALGDLGLPADERDRHIAYDIGAAGVARHLADMLDAPALIAGYSRLVIDLNRPPDDFTAIREISDRTLIPGNRNLTAGDRAAREAALFRPYHNAAAGLIAARRAGGRVPVIVSVHSCTDVYLGRKRDLDIGLLSNRDRRLADRLLAIFARDPALDVRDNEPYSGLDAYGYSIETHALPAGLANILFEFRQDLIRSPEGQRHWAGIAGRALAEALADPALYEPFAR